ncbi:ATP-binding cassette domain-containing protein [Candidatus Woesearchaeota archaeon]|nr:ATP-binding cassette domain-containing protein [Candidatus Woesearchaeota archaeon]
MVKRDKHIIRIVEAWKTYKMGDVDVHALRGMNFEVEYGEFVAIMGPSGSGKSTAVNMVGCLDVPTKGDIYLEGKNISTLSESQLAQIRGKKIGFIFQQFNLISTLTAKRNVTLPMVFQGVGYRKRVRRAEKLLKMVGLGERMQHKPTELSGGQQQRVAIARALANDPDVILADEPTGNLDSKTGKEMMDFLCNLHKKEKKTIVMVTHDPRLAKFAERIAHLRDGSIVKR